VRVPQDVSVVGFDDLPISRYVLPPLTTVQHPAYELGKIAGTAMLQLLRGETPQVEVPPPRVVVRESTRSPAART
jgi:LacI family transcriptional regulator